jgi:O-antigen ligase
MKPPDSTKPLPGDGRITISVVDPRVVAMLIVVASVPLDPTWALREGALLSGLVLLFSCTSFRPRAADWIFFLYTVWVVASATWTLAPDITSVSVKNQVGCFFIFTGLRATARSVKVVGSYVAAFTAGCLMIVLKLYRENPDFRVTWRFDFSADRLAITGLNQNYTAYALATGLALLAIVWPRAQARRTRFGLAVVAALLYVGIVQQGTRGAALALALLAVWIIVGKRAPSASLRIVVWSFAAWAIALSTGMADKVIRENLSVGKREHGDLNGRLPTWSIARQVIDDHPLRGAGAGAFRALNPYGIGAHNAFLEVTAGVGIIGVTLFIVTLYLALVREARSASSSAANQTTVPVILVLAPILLSGHWNESPAAWASIGIVSAWASILNRSAEGSPSEESRHPSSFATGATAVRSERRTGHPEPLSNAD